MGVRHGQRIPGQRHVLFEHFSIAGFPIDICGLVLVNISVLTSRWQIYLFAFLAYSGLLVTTLTSFNFEFLIQDISFPLLAVVTAETMNGFKHILAVQLHRREIINKVAGSLSSSLESTRRRPRQWWAPPSKVPWMPIPIMLAF